jgi:hypothetical protein
MSFTGLLAMAKHEKCTPKFGGPLDEFFSGLSLAIAKKARAFFRENQEITFVVGRPYDAPYSVAPHFKNIGKVQSYSVFFRAQISPAVGPEVVSAGDSFILAPLSTASLDKKCLEQIVNLQSDTIAFKKEKQRHFVTENSLRVGAVLFCPKSQLRCQTGGSRT